MSSVPNGVTTAACWRCTQEIYKDFCSAGVACEHPELLWLNENGEIAEKEEEAFVCKSKFELIHPEWVLFVDE
jgi:hypothetical protein